MQGQVVSMEIRVHGKPVREYQHKGTRWIEGRKGSDFTLRFQNLTSRRILVVPSVDGLSIMDGETAISDESSGYILAAYEHIDVPGWRLNNEDVAKFVFGKKGKSYAAKKGKPTDVGVIGVAAFYEKAYQRFTGILRSSGMKGPSGQSRGMGPAIQSFNCSHSLAPDSGRASLDSMHVEPSSQATCQVETGTSTGRDAALFNQPVSQEIGTEFGGKVSHAVVEVPFEKASDTADEKLAIRYDSKRNLRRRGVDLDQKPRVAHEPNAFPGDEAGCKPPTDWTP